MRNHKLKKFLSGSVIVGIASAWLIATLYGFEVLVERFLYAVFYVSILSVVVAAVLKKSKKIKL